MDEGSSVRLARISAIGVAMALVTCTPKGSLDESGAPATSPPTGSAVDETSGPLTMAQAKACCTRARCSSMCPTAERSTFETCSVFASGSACGVGKWVKGARAAKLAR